MTISRAWSSCLGIACTGLVLVVAALFSSSPSLANPADRQAATKIDADTLAHDEQKLTTVFSGNVVLSKGSLLLKGNRLELRQQPNGTMMAVITGTPAQFRQQRGQTKEWIEGEGQTIEYDGTAELVTITGQATMRRTLNDALLDQVAGDRLRYNNILETYQVEALPGMPRARMTLMPKPPAANAP
ncbi:MAG: lipopolysaccharide transport periplasmic protein LptA [Burkholderiaceae bacterium]